MNFADADTSPSPNIPTAVREELLAFPRRVPAPLPPPVQGAELDQRTTIALAARAASAEWARMAHVRGWGPTRACFILAAVDKALEILDRVQYELATFPDYRAWKEGTKDVVPDAYRIARGAVSARFGWDVPRFAEFAPYARAALAHFRDPRVGPGPEDQEGGAVFDWRIADGYLPAVADGFVRSSVLTGPDGAAFRVEARAPKRRRTAAAGEPRWTVKAEDAKPAAARGARRERCVAVQKASVTTRCADEAFARTLRQLGVRTA